MGRTQACLFAAAAALAGVGVGYGVGLSLLFVRPERKQDPSPAFSAFAPQALVGQATPGKAAWVVLSGDESSTIQHSSGCFSVRQFVGTCRMSAADQNRFEDALRGATRKALADAGAQVHTNAGGGQSSTSTGADGKPRALQRRYFELRYRIAGWEGYASAWLSGDGDEVTLVLLLHEGK
jgi:hypothetical protein